MATTPREDFSGFLRARRPDLVAAVAAEIAAQIEPAGDAPSAEALAGGLVGAAVDALVGGRSEALEAWAQGYHALGREQGATVDHARRLLAILRRQIVRAGREAVEAGAAGAWDGLERALALVDDLAAALSARFRDDAAAAHEALREGEARFRELYQRTPAMLHTVDADGWLIAVSDRWLETLGYTREEVLGRRSVEFMTEASRHLAVEVRLPLFFQQGSCKDLDYQYVTKTGEVLDLHLSAVAVLDEAGQRQRSLVALVDVTEQLRAERALREAEERYRGLVEFSPVAILVQRDGKFVYANAAAARMLAAERPEQIVGMDGADVVDPDYSPVVRELIRSMTESPARDTPRVERWRRLDGTHVIVEVAARRIPFEGGSAMQLVCADVTERDRAEKALRRAAAQEALLRVQEETLRALSTPLIPVSDRVLVMPLVGHIDAARAGRILEELLAGVSRHQASVAILDVTGVPQVDAAVADALARAARAVRLLGARVVLTGIQPAMAQTMVELGLDLGDIVTRSTLQAGIAHALR